MQNYESVYDLFNHDDEIKRNIINAIIENYNRVDALTYGFDKKLEILDILCGCLQGLDKDLNDFLEHCREVLNVK